MHAELTQERLKQVLRYDPETGVFTWLVCHKSGLIGKRAGSICPPARPECTRYRVIHVGGHLHPEHRVAYLYMTGSWPEHHIDHKDRNGLNNRWENLRPATRAQNACNRKINVNSSTGFKGVSRHGSGWRARIVRGGRRVSVGTFSTQQEAGAAYVAAANLVYGEFARAA